jgi:hypothetical protein
VVIFEPGTTSEEKALASARSGNTITLAQRALEGSAVSHTASSVIRHGLSAVDVNEANYAVSQTVGLVAAKGDLLYGSAANTLVKLGKGSANQSPMWDSSGALVAGNPAPGAHTHPEGDVTSLVSDLAALQAQQSTNTTAITANTSAITALQGATGGLLKVIQNAGSHSYQNTSTSVLTALDTSNLRATFPAPASGNVLVRLTGDATTSGTYWGLLSGATAKGPTVSAYGVNVSTAPGIRSVSLYITGLSGSVSLDWAAYNTGGTGLGVLTTSSTDPATMEVWAA